MAFVTNPGARQRVLHCHFTSGQCPFLLRASPQPREGWHAGATGMLRCRHLSGEAQAVRLGPTVTPLARDVLLCEHPPSGFSVTSKKSPPRFSGHFVPRAGITA